MSITDVTLSPAMADRPLRPPRLELAPGLEVPRVLTGLWQVADMERDGTPLDADAAGLALAAYADAGFDGFDMADHYGSAEILVGRYLARARPGHATAFTKWCPLPGPMTPEVVRQGIQQRLERLGLPRIDLLQFHWWQYRHPGYLDAMLELDRLRHEGRIGHLGVTNFDADHLRLLVTHGIPVVSNQVSFSLLDRRPAGRMTEVCRETGVKLLAYGVLAGGFLSDRWVDRPEPTHIPDWSKSKYRRFIDTVGGWNVLQRVLVAAKAIAVKHGVSVANVAARWVLEQEAVGAVIIGARLGEREHRGDNLAVFGFALDDADNARLAEAHSVMREIPGDCGDEYRKPPFLTASGDLSHHLAGLPPVFESSASRVRPARQTVGSGSRWEPIAGYARAVRAGHRILVSGTTATHGENTVVCPGDAQGQTVYVLDKIGAAIEALGGELDDVVRTRIYVRDVACADPVARVHGRYFGAIRPANTLVQVAGLVGGYEVEIEAEADVSG
jgi:aryl-alcohol dehydrogenase-like predicted oxidoreductase/enamine deaminase RidA (YjgF/YER057c/UK114 family)